MVHNDRATFADTHTIWLRAQFPETMHRELSAVKTHAGVHVQQDNIIWHFLYVDGESCMEPRDHHPSLQVIVFGIYRDQLHVWAHDMHVPGCVSPNAK